MKHQQEILPQILSYSYFSNKTIININNLPHKFHYDVTFWANSTKTAVNGRLTIIFKYISIRNNRAYSGNKIFHYN